MSGLSALPALTRLKRAGALITAELDARPRRLTDYAAENSALHALAQALTASDTAMLQKLVDTALALSGDGSAGISLCERESGQPRAHLLNAAHFAAFPARSAPLPACKTCPTATRTADALSIQRMGT